ncbi:SDR family NAD(P)-dependent oxidoreductase [Streptomyces sp. MCAF7]
MSDTKTFLITGVSTGLGRALACAALAAGHRVVGTVRTPAAARAFEALAGDAHARILDVTDHDAVDTVVDETERDLGPVDVLVANAGYGHDGLFEESSMDDLRRQFEVNVYGTVAVIKAVLPHMRERRSGHIIAVTSMGGLITMPDPDKAAAAVLRIVAADQPPTRLLLGTDALRLVQAGRDAFERDMLAWAELSASTDFDDVSRSA